MEKGYSDKGRCIIKNNGENMKQNSRCYGCVYCQMCDKEQEQKCASKEYILFTTEAQKRLCDLICGEIEKNDDN